MTARVKSRRLLGINGLGRIGKLTLWNFLHRGHFDGIVINMGREVGMSVDDLVQVIETDSTYGTLGNFLYGYTTEAGDQGARSGDRRSAGDRRHDGEGPPGSEESRRISAGAGKGCAWSWTPPASSPTRPIPPITGAAATGNEPSTTKKKKKKFFFFFFFFF